MDSLARAAADRLAALFKTPVTVTWTRNRLRYLSLRREPGVVRLRLDARFVSAPPEILAAVAQFERDPGPAKTVMRAWLAATEPAAGGERPRRRPPMQPPVGRVYDLERMAAELADRWLGTPFPPTRLGWGPRRAARSVRRLRLGAWSAEHGALWLHPVLDHPDVPRVVVESVLFHEMAHAVVGLERRGGRTVAHGAAFRAVERRYPHHGEAEAWMRTHIAGLIRRARALRPV